MPSYQDHPTKAKTPSRKSRKGQRNTVFMNNKLAFRKLRELRAEKRRELAELMQAENPSPLETSF